MTYLTGDVIIVQHASHTFGGRRIETPQGGAPPPTHPWRSGKSGIDAFSWQVFDIYGFLVRSGRSWLSWHSGQKSRKNHSRTLPYGASGPQKSSPGPPKSSPEPSKTPFLNDIYFKKAYVGGHDNFCGPKWPTWLQLGGPRPSQIEAEIPQKSMLKNNTFKNKMIFGIDF